MVILYGSLIVICIMGHASLASVPILAKISPQVAGIREVFSREGTVGFRILKREDTSLLIGGREMLVTVNHMEAHNPQIAIEKFRTCDNGNALFQCRHQSAFQRDRDCFNFIRVAEELMDNLLLVCGSNALNPRCYICTVNRSAQVIQSVQCPGPDGTGDAACQFTTAEGQGTFDGSNVAPKHWQLNATSVYSDGKLFFGVSSKNDKSQTAISRLNVNLGADGSETVFTSRLDTTSYLSRSVNEADFVGKPIIIGERVYFFYRETAVEHINQGNMVYSRVARVCKDDSGLGSYWSSFQKARLNCSISNAFPVYYNELQDIFVEQQGSDHLIHAVFTMLSYGPQTSAVCVFKLSDIDAIFDSGRFRGPRSPGSIWLTRPNSEVPVPRPGRNCSKPTKNRRFIEQFPLMQQLVENFNPHDEVVGQSDAPVLTMDGMRFTSVVVDSVSQLDIYYIGTEDGSVLKAYHDGSEFKVYELMVTEGKQPLTGLHLSGLGSSRHLLAVSDNKIYNIPLQDCATQCRQKCSEFLHGYCEWDNGCCRQIGETACATPSSDIHISPIHEGAITACERDSVQLICHAETGPFCPEVTIQWTWDKGQSIEGMGHVISLDSLDDQLTNKLSMLTVRTVITQNQTTFECTARMTGTSQSVQRVAQLQIKNCITNGSLKRRYTRHMQLQTQNKESKRCHSSFFDCDNCPAP